MSLLPATALAELAADLERAISRVQDMRSSGNDISVLDYADMADRLRRISLKRPQFFPDLPLFDPAWHILLDLYQADAAGRRLSVSAICGDCGAPPTTALRYIDLIIRAGFAIRVRDERDGRRIWIVISDAGRLSIEQYLAAFVTALR